MGTGGQISEDNWNLNLNTDNRSKLNDSQQAVMKPEKTFLQNIVSSFLRIKIFLKCCWNNWKIFETLAKKLKFFLGFKK